MIGESALTERPCCSGRASWCGSIGGCGICLRRERKPAQRRSAKPPSASAAGVKPCPEPVEGAAEASAGVGARPADGSSRACRRANPIDITAQ